MGSSSFTLKVIVFTVLYLCLFFCFLHFFYSESKVLWSRFVLNQVGLVPGLKLKTSIQKINGKLWKRGCSLTVELYDTDHTNSPHWHLDDHAHRQWPPLCCWTLWNLSVLNWTTSFLCVCVFACVCDAFVHKGLLLYESLWWWLCKFHLFSSLLPVIAQVPNSSSCLCLAVPPPPSLPPFPHLLLLLTPASPSFTDIHFLACLCTHFTFPAFFFFTAPTRMS